jgi:hypothetical protein
LERRGRTGGGGRGGNRLSAYATIPCYLCVAVALAVSKALTYRGVSIALPQPRLRGRGDAAKGPVASC